MKVLAVVALMMASYWCIENFVPGLMVTVGLVIKIAGNKKTDDGIDGFCVLGLGIGVLAGLAAAFT